MFVLRNNLKGHMAFTLPKGANLWSALVDDEPVAPLRDGEGRLLVPLEASQPVDEDGEDSYRALHERRRAGEGRLEIARAARQDIAESPAGAADLEPYDVEIVFVSPKLVLEEKGKLPKCDIPVGKLAWPVFAPDQIVVLDSSGNVKRVASFSLPFRHFAELEYERQLAASAKDQEQSMEAAQAAMSAQAAAEATASGVLPVRVALPIAGKIERFEKTLLVDEVPEIKVLHRRKRD